MSTILLPRLIKPTKTALGQVGSVVDVVLLGLTILGALGIFAGMAYREIQTGSSTVRSRLLAFLVWGDLVMGIVGMISPAYYLMHDRGPDGRLCDATAFLLISTFWVQYLNAVVMAVSTWLILLHPLSYATRLLQRFWAWLFPITWGLGFIAGGVAWRVTGFAFRSGFCYHDPKKGPKYFGDIYAIVPRGIVFIIVVTLYTNLFIFLRRPDRISTPTSSQVDEINVRSTISSSEGNHHWWSRKRVLGAEIAGEDEGIPPNRRLSTYTPAQRAVPSSPTRPEFARRTTSEKGGAPWESLDLQVPEVSFSAYVDPLAPRSPPARRVSIANLGTSEPNTPYTSSRRGSAVAFSNPLAPLADTRELPVSLLTPPTPTLPSDNYFAFPPASTASLAAPVSPYSHPAVSYSSPSSQTPLNLPSQSPHGRSEDSTLSEPDEEAADLTDSSSDADSLSPPEKRRGSRAQQSRKQSHAMSLKEILDQTGPVQQAGGGSALMSPGGSTWGISSGGGAGGKPELDNTRTPQGGRSGSGIGTGSGSDGYVSQESMNAYLNRKASMLMILFPLAYVALFSVSLVRIICDFIVADPIAYLSGLSRWMIFSQGIVDFIIYGAVEYKVKRDVRRKTSAGYFAPQSGAGMPRSAAGSRGDVMENNPSHAPSHTNTYHV